MAAIDNCSFLYTVRSIHKLTQDVFDTYGRFRRKTCYIDGDGFVCRNRVYIHF
ncbi:MAG: hypothetical protein K0S33_3269 [Bacteroidetes bacterium]|nr:hypothetical protein [Bacteroidota bacterium]